MSDDDLAALRTGEAWAAFCDDLKAAGGEILASDAPDDDLSRAEGFRYLTRLLRLSLEKHIEFGDPRCPQFYSLSHETAKIGNDNPDNFYLNCAVDGTLDYRIRGNRGSVDYLSIESKAGSFAGGGDMAPTGHITLDDLELDANGDFELLVSSDRQTGNWLPMSGHTDNLLVRQTFRDRAKERKAELSIECLNPGPAPVMNADDFAHSLAQVVPFVSGTASLFRGWMGRFSEHINALPPNDQSMCLQAGGDPAIHYHNSYWQLREDEALLISFRPPSRCRTWNFQLSNFWMESLDYRYHRISINHHTAVTEADGRVVILVTENDPGAGFANWLTTAGHHSGAMLLRYVEASEFPPITTRVVAVEALATGGVDV